MITAENLTIERRNTILFWARFTISDLQKSIRKRNIGRTHSLINSLKYNDHLTSDGGGSVELEFEQHGKFIDMMVGRGRKLEDIQQNRMIYQAVGRKIKNTKWLSSPAYKQIAALGYILAEKYGEDAGTLIKEQITNKINMSM